MVLINVETTPIAIDNEVQKLIAFVCPNAKPIYLPVEPESYAKVNECILATTEKINRDGGSQVTGWQILESNIIVEAVFHAVWKSPKGELKDITPNQTQNSKILFFPDPKVKYVGKQIDNIRINISGNRLVDDFIEIAKAIFKIKNKGKRAFEREIALDVKEVALCKDLQRISIGIILMAQDGKNRNSLCFCDSNNKYKHCHGKKLAKLLNQI